MKPLLLALAWCFVLPAASREVPETPERRLVRLLNAENSWPAAYREVAAARIEWVPRLLEWAEKPPPDAQTPIFSRGLIRLFGEIKVKDAIPYLVRNVDWQGTRIGPVWSKPEEVILLRMPAVNALLRIGTDVLPALVKAYLGPSTAEQRLAIVFTLSRLKDPRALSVLRDAQSFALTEQRFAQEGLILLKQTGRDRAPKTDYH